MRAVLLAGGRGQRLRPYTTIIPKPLVPIGDRPIMEHIVRCLHKCGVRHIDVCLGHLGELIQTYFGQATTLPADLELAWHWEDEPLGTAGAIKVVSGLDETFIAMNGDILTTLDYSDLMSFHREREAALTVAMHSRRVDIDLGVIESSDGYITGYREKPSLDYDVSMGIYVYEPRALTHIPDGPFQFPDLVLALIAAGEQVAAYRCDAEWYDVGTFDELERATRVFTERPDVFAGRS
ncbi:MAG: sugar phosphate nucleotidyltransferase [Solirubrobacteraceae bacterium]